MKFPFAIFRISGHSMEPTIKNGALVLVNQGIKNPRVGDVVVTRAKNEEFLVKRVKEIRGEEVFLEGDNKTDSLDSRKLGSFKKEDILGKVVMNLV